MGKLVLLKFCFFSILFISCNVTESENNVPYSPDHKIPVTGGIYLTNEDNPAEIEKWGNPSTPGEWIIPSHNLSEYGYWNFNYSDLGKSSSMH